MISISSNTGAVNSSLGGMSPAAIVSFLVVMFVQAIPGGAGMGMIYMIIYVILTLFIVGLMVGKTPEFMSMKISPRDIKLAVFIFLSSSCVDTHSSSNRFFYRKRSGNYWRQSDATWIYSDTLRIYFCGCQ